MVGIARLFFKTGHKQNITNITPVLTQFQFDVILFDDFLDVGW
ncbi:hypothetical protein Xbud_01445 [Xenorhabdus budapestensis]|uniref:Uncharacterized protein n=1 Tax=Xenorhabdus budapestensis TaxID=290110 RepID=A0A2D0J267_XENBU|nr:hypothetical protein Xbud_01445 [Xenorhabdus budapestensis]